MTTIFESLKVDTYADLACNSQANSAAAYARARALADDYMAGNEFLYNEALGAQSDAATSAESARLFLREVLNGSDDGASYVAVGDYAGRFSF